MKKLTKMLLGSGASLMLAAGGVMTYLQAQHPAEAVSDLTLANIEALAKVKEAGEGYEFVSKNYQDVGGGTVRVVCTCSGDGSIDCC